MTYNKSKIRRNADGEIEKTCTRCEAWLPHTKEYFRPDTRMKSGLKSWCRVCQNEVRALHRETPKGREQMKQDRVNRKKRLQELKEENAALKAEIERIKSIVDTVGVEVRPL